MQIAVRELKNHLSRVLDLAQRGESVEVTSRNKPVARIVGIAPQADPGLRRLIASAALSWPGGKPELARPVSLHPHVGPELGQMVLEERACSG